MPDPSVLSQADALMRRHRSFVARGSAADNSALHQDAERDELDIPVLTEVVAEADAVSLEEKLRASIENALNSWIEETLPQRIDLLTEQIREQLLTSLSAEARASLLPSLLATLSTLDMPHRGTRASL